MTTSFRPSQNGLFDDSILCSVCDNYLGANENFALKALDTLRGASKGIINDYAGPFTASGNQLIQFAAGVGWKYCVTKPHYGRIDVGPYANILKQVAFDKSGCSPTIDMFMIRLKANQFEEHFFRAPKPDRKDGVNLIRMTLGGFLMFVKIDKRNFLGAAPRNIWMRDSCQITFPVLPLESFEEGQFVTKAWLKDQKLQQFILKNLGISTG